MLEAEERLEGARSAGGSPETCFFEVTVASVDQPKLLSRLSECLVRARARATRHPAGGHARCGPSQTTAWGSPPCARALCWGPALQQASGAARRSGALFGPTRWSSYAKWRE